MKSGELFVPGKLMITGEYVVLDGATCYAVKTKYGQFIKVDPTGTEFIEWRAQDDQGKVWLHFNYDLINRKMHLISGDEDPVHIAALIESLLDQDVLSGQDGFRCKTQLTFPRQWGLGSSSTVVAGLALFLDVNPYELLANSFGGSGYDVAVGYENSGLFYSRTDDPARPEIERYNWKPEFEDSLYFVYLNEKVDSRDAMAYYQKNKDTSACSITDMSELTNAAIRTNDPDEFAMLIRSHEKIMAKVLNRPRIKEERFPDYPGEIKSLGAWGGDFCLAIGNTGSPDYFRDKGYEEVFKFSGIVDTSDNS